MNPDPPSYWQSAIQRNPGLPCDIPDAHAALGKQFLNPYEDTFAFGAVAKFLNDIF
jgi:hypothetical protein